MEKELKINYFAFYGLSGKDELYYVTKSNRNKFYKEFRFDLFTEYQGDDFRVYDWVSSNCKFIGFVVCAI